MSGSMVDEKLLRVVSGPKPASIKDVIEAMQTIDAALPNDDGLKWFNFLYLKVTSSVLEDATESTWADPAWLTRLDVVFANLYFAAIANFVNHDPATPALGTPCLKQGIALASTAYSLH